jgi:hypothetical protein
MIIFFRKLCPHGKERHRRQTKVSLGVRESLFFFLFFFFCVCEGQEHFYTSNMEKSMEEEGRGRKKEREREREMEEGRERLTGESSRRMEMGDNQQPVRNF